MSRRQKSSSPANKATTAKLAAVSASAGPATGQPTGQGALRPGSGEARLAIGVFLAACLLRVIHVLQFRDSPFFLPLVGDAAGYDRWARRLAAGDWIGSEVFYQSPLYPYLLGAVYALAGPDVLVVRVLQGLAGAAGCALIAVASARLFGAKAGIVSGLLLALFAPAIFYDALVQKASLDFFLSSLLLFLLVPAEKSISSRQWFAVGAVLGLLCLNRENALLLVPLVVAWSWWTTQGAPRPLAPMIPIRSLLVGVALILAPVAARNLVVGGQLQLTTSQLGPNLYIGNNENADGFYHPLVAGRGSPEFEQADAQALAEKAERRSLTPREVSHYWSGRALAWIRENPGDWLALTARKLLLVWNAREVMDTEDISSHADHSPVLRATRALFHFGLLAPLGLLGLWAARSRLEEIGLFGAMLLVYTLSVVPFSVFGRYRYPLVPILALFAGAGVVWLGAALRERNWRTALPGIAGLLLAIAVVNLPLGAASSMAALGSENEMRARTLGNFARENTATGNRERAVEMYRQALVLTPNSPSLLSALGTDLAALGRYPEALPVLQQASSAEPDRAAPHNSLGTVYSALARPEPAIAEFRAALAIEPGNADFIFNLGTALSLAGRVDEAIVEYRRAAALDPDNPGIRNNLGITLARAGRIAEAVGEFERAAALQPGNQETQRNLARARAMLAGSAQPPTP